MDYQKPTRTIQTQYEQGLFLEEIPAIQGRKETHLHKRKRDAKFFSAIQKESDAITIEDGIAFFLTICMNCLPALNIKKPTRIHG